MFWQNLFHDGEPGPVQSHPVWHCCRSPGRYWLVWGLYGVQLSRSFCDGTLLELKSSVSTFSTQNLLPNKYYKVQKFRILIYSWVIYPSLSYLMYVNNINSILSLHVLKKFLKTYSLCYKFSFIFYNYFLLYIDTLYRLSFQVYVPI